jgi:hypothetical protein
MLVVAELRVRQKSFTALIRVIFAAGTIISTIAGVIMTSSRKGGLLSR